MRSTYINPAHDKLIKDKEQREGTKPREYIVWHVLYHRTDSRGSIHHSYLPNNGIYPKLQPVTRVVKDSHGWESKKVVRAEVVRNAYSVLFTKENVQKLIADLGEGSLRDLSTEEGRKRAMQDQINREKWASKNNKVLYETQENEFTHFMVHEESGQSKRPVESFHDWLEGDFDDLATFGHIPMSEERENRRIANNVPTSMSG